MKTAARSVRLFGPALLCAALAYTGCKQTVTESTGGAGGHSSTSDTGSGGDTTSTTTTSSTTSTTGPIMCLLGGVTQPAIMAGECDLLQQDCPTGNTCVPTQDGKSTFCRFGGGLKSAGKDCTPDSLDECQAGLFCIGPVDGVGTCTRPCCPGTDEPCNGGDCLNEVTYQSGLKVLMCTYFQTCTLFDPTSCPEGKLCQLFYPEQNRAVCTSAAPMPVPEGGTCKYINQCDAEQVCYQQKVCRYSCILGSNAAPGQGGCPAGQACQDVYMGVAGMFGVCQPGP